ncbi:MAG: hypothetical protein RLZ98_609 [Pseudomonadota bacterium]|jgi:Fuc2NAc and GlcNAc transferase
MIDPALVMLLLGAATASAVLARWVSLHGSILNLSRDPNHRSMHMGRIAHGGGVGVVVAGTLAGLALVLCCDRSMAAPVILALTLGATGFADDVWHLTRRIRLVIQIGATLALIFIYSPLADPFGPGVTPAVLTAAAVLFATVWWINLFNFMDGIDGLAATEGIFIITVAAAAIGASAGISALGGMVPWMLAVASATAGFLVYNWPPARVFMGDTSSLYLPFVILVAALATTSSGILTYPFWVILAATFIADATVTLVVRIATGQKWADSHRTHAYQKLALAFGSHLPTLLIYNAANLIWLTPLALIALAWPQYGWMMVIIAYLPLVLFAIGMRAGKMEEAVPAYSEEN